MKRQSDVKSCMNSSHRLRKQQSRSRGIGIHLNSGRRESPKLYKLVTTVAVDGKVVDRKETEFGIRTVGVRPDKRIFAERQAL